MTAKYCVFGEGPNDIGYVEWGGSGKLIQEGCYAGFLKAVKKRKDFECLKAVSFIGLKGPGSHKNRPVLQGFRRHAYYAARMAATAGADILLIGTDVDRGRTSQSTYHDRVKYLSKYREEFEDGYKIACAENPAVEQLRVIVIVPLCKLESWLIVDEKAFSDVAGFQRGVLQKHPEEMCGQTDAKEFMDSRFKDNDRTKPDTAMLYEIALKSSPNVLEKMCPVSYPPFLAQCKSLYCF